MKVLTWAAVAVLAFACPAQARSHHRHSRPLADRGEGTPVMQGGTSVRVNAVGQVITSFPAYKPAASMRQPVPPVAPSTPSPSSPPKP